MYVSIYIMYIVIFDVRIEMIKFWLILYFACPNYLRWSITLTLIASWMPVSMKYGRPFLSYRISSYRFSPVILLLPNLSKIFWVKLLDAAMNVYSQPACMFSYCMNWTVHYKLTCKIKNNIYKYFWNSWTGPNYL